MAVFMHRWGKSTFYIMRFETIHKMIHPFVVLVIYRRNNGQGSILGLHLFLIYVNDIHMVSRSLVFILYADDTTLTSPICSFTQGGNTGISEISNLIDLELTKISDWFAVNKLPLNAEKTKFMIFHNHQKIITQNKIRCLKIYNTNIERVTEFNFLGLTINEHLT